MKPNNYYLKKTSENTGSDPESRHHTDNYYLQKIAENTEQGGGGGGGGSNLRLITVKCDSWKLETEIGSIEAQPQYGCYCMLMGGSGASYYFCMNTFFTNENEETYINFEFLNVPNGQYDLCANFMNKTTTLEIIGTLTVVSGTDEYTVEIE